MSKISWKSAVVAKPLVILPEPAMHGRQTPLHKMKPHRLRHIRLKPEVAVNESRSDGSLMAVIKVSQIADRTSSKMSQASSSPAMKTDNKQMGPTVKPDDTMAPNNITEIAVPPVPSSISNEEVTPMKANATLHLLNLSPIGEKAPPGILSRRLLVPFKGRDKKSHESKEPPRNLINGSSFKNDVFSTAFASLNPIVCQSQASETIVNAAVVSNLFSATISETAKPISPPDSGNQTLNTVAFQLPGGPAMESSISHRTTLPSASIPLPAGLLLRQKLHRKKKHRLPVNTAEVTLDVARQAELVGAARIHNHYMEYSNVKEDEAKYACYAISGEAQRSPPAKGTCGFSIIKERGVEQDPASGINQAPRDITRLPPIAHCGRDPFFGGEDYSTLTARLADALASPTSLKPPKSSRPVVRKCDIDAEPSLLLPPALPQALTARDTVALLEQQTRTEMARIDTILGGNDSELPLSNSSNSPRGAIEAVSMMSDKDHASPPRQASLGDYLALQPRTDDDRSLTIPAEVSGGMSSLISVPHIQLHAAGNSPLNSSSCKTSAIDQLLTLAYADTSSTGAAHKRTIHTKELLELESLARRAAAYQAFILQKTKEKKKTEGPAAGLMHLVHGKKKKGRPKNAEIKDTSKSFKQPVSLDPLIKGARRRKRRKLAAAAARLSKLLSGRERTTTSILQDWQRAVYKKNLTQGFVSPEDLLEDPEFMSLISVTNNGDDPFESFLSTVDFSEGSHSSSSSSSRSSSTDSSSTNKMGSGESEDEKNCLDFDMFLDDIDEEQVHYGDIKESHTEPIDALLATIEQRRRMRAAAAETAIHRFNRETNPYKQSAEGQEMKDPAKTSALLASRLRFRKRAAAAAATRARLWRIASNAAGVPPDVAEAELNELEDRENAEMGALQAAFGKGAQEGKSCDKERQSKFSHTGTSIVGGVKIIVRPSGSEHPVQPPANDSAQRNMPTTIQNVVSGIHSGTLQPSAIIMASKAAEESKSSEAKVRDIMRESLIAPKIVDEEKIKPKQYWRVLHRGPNAVINAALQPNSPAATSNPSSPRDGQAPGVDVLAKPRLSSQPIRRIPAGSVVASVEVLRIPPQYVETMAKNATISQSLLSSHEDTSAGASTRPIPQSVWIRIEPEGWIAAEIALPPPIGSNAPPASVRQLAPVAAPDSEKRGQPFEADVLTGSVGTGAAIQRLADECGLRVATALAQSFAEGTGVEGTSSYDVTAAEQKRRLLRALPAGGAAQIRAAWVAMGGAAGPQDQTSGINITNLVSNIGESDMADLTFGQDAMKDVLINL